MADVETCNIAGCSVYGVQQVQYRVNGSERCDYARTLAAISLTRAASIEDDVGAITYLLRLRMKKIEDLGAAMAAVEKALIATDGEGAKVTDKLGSYYDQHLAGPINTLVACGVEISASIRNSNMTRGDLQKVETRAKYVLDKEQNELQQDSLSVQNMISKRDSAYSNASSLMKKVYDDMTELIRKIGG